METFGIYENEDVCANCRNFVQHYAQGGPMAGLRPINAGHCTEPRLRDKKPGDSCPRFATKEGERR